MLQWVSSNPDKRLKINIKHMDSNKALMITTLVLFGLVLVVGSVVLFLTLKPEKDMVDIVEEPAMVDDVNTEPELVVDPPVDAEVIDVDEITIPDLIEQPVGTGTETAGGELMTSITSFEEYTGWCQSLSIMGDNEPLLIAIGNKEPDQVTVGDVKGTTNLLLEKYGMVMVEPSSGLDVYHQVKQEGLQKLVAYFDTLDQTTPIGGLDLSPTATYVKLLEENDAQSMSLLNPEQAVAMEEAGCFEI